MLTVRDLSVRFGPLNVLDRLSFSVGRREVVSILGPSGCGKTTLRQPINLRAELERVGSG
jgi:ABC-type sugar transport system ATPase subunit